MFKEPQELEEYIQRQRRLKTHVPLTQRLKDKIGDKLKVQMGKQSIYVWRSRRFEEVMYLHFPRFLFLGFSCYVIYKINLR